MAIGLLNGVYQEDVTHLTAQFMRQFAERNGAVRCIDILGFNVGSINNEFEVGSVKDFFQFLAPGREEIVQQGCEKRSRGAPGRVERVGSIERIIFDYGFKFPIGIYPKTWLLSSENAYGK